MTARTLSYMLFVAVVAPCGCMTQRYAGQYDGGMVYEGVGDVKTYRKFYIRFFDLPDGYRARVSAAKIQEIIPELLNRHARPGDIPVDITIRPSDITVSGGWTAVFGILGGILPVVMTFDQDVCVDIAIPDMKTLNPTVNNHFTYDRKMTVLSPLAAIPYSEKDGFQEHQFENGAESMVDESEVFSRTIARGIAARLKQAALERLELPNIDFIAGKESP